MRSDRSLFVACDGPKNSGKSSVLPLVGRELRARGFTVLLTKEPTPSFSLANEEQRTGLDLAQLIAEDRSSHVAREILPALSAGNLVLCDRYIASSLVFHRIDGLTVQEIWNLNQEFRLPDLNIFLMASALALVRRKRQRASLTRLEQMISEDEEIELYVDARGFMRRLGVVSVTIDNDDGDDPQAVALQIVESVRRRLEGRQ